MKQEGLKERVELLEIGERLGFPRLGYGRSTKIPHDRRIPQGQPGWEKFCQHAHVRRIMPALRIGRVLRDNNVEVFHPLSGAELAPKPPYIFRPIEGAPLTATSGPVTSDLLSDIVDFENGPKVIESVTTLPRPKKGGHKQPPRPGTKRWLAQQAQAQRG